MDLVAVEPEFNLYIATADTHTRRTTARRQVRLAEEHSRMGVAVDSCLGWMLYYPSHGTNDAQKTMGSSLLPSTRTTSGNSPDSSLLISPHSRIQVSPLGGLSFARARWRRNSAGGWRIIRTLGTNGEASARARFAADHDRRGLIQAASSLRQSLSTTHVISHPIMGVGTVKVSAE